MTIDEIKKWRESYNSFDEHPSLAKIKGVIDDLIKIVDHQTETIRYMKKFERLHIPHQGKITTRKEL